MCLVFGICGCSSQPLRIGKDITVWPSKHRWKKAFKNAVSDPHTWVPAAGAAVTQIGDIDHDLSRWASSNTPVYGSQSRANDASDQLLVANRLGMWATALAVPDKENSWESKFQRASVQSAGVMLTHFNSMYLKDSTLRQRPDGTNFSSFPSAHSSGSAAFAAMGKQNTELLPIPKYARTGIKGLFNTMAAGTAWGRVEANVHYPSDVLAGYALGNFFARFINDAFLMDDAVSISLPIGGNDAAIKFEKRF